MSHDQWHDETLERFAQGQIADLGDVADRLEARGKSAAISKIAEDVRAGAQRLKLLSCRIADEANEFARRVDQAKFADELDELDTELAEREATFRVLLSNHRWYVRRVAEKVRYETEVSGFVISLNGYMIESSLVFTQQLSGERGFLLPKTVDSYRGDESIQAARDIAQSTAATNRKLSGESVWLARRLFLKYRVRYALHWLQRFLGEAAVSFVIFVLLAGYVTEYFDLRIVGLGALVAFGLYLLEKRVTRYLQRKWLIHHRKKLMAGALRLYSDYMLFLRSRVFATIAAKDYKP